jgi:hypothetical protein
MRRGRIGAAELSVVSLRPGTQALRPPEDAPADVVKLFRSVVANCPPGHLAQSDVPLIISFCTATLLATKAAKASAKNPDMVSTWERAVRVQTTVATKLRLTPHSRTHPLTTARRMRDRTLKPRLRGTAVSKSWRRPRSAFGGRADNNRRRIAFAPVPQWFLENFASGTEPENALR